MLTDAESAWPLLMTKAHMSTEFLHDGIIFPCIIYPYAPDAPLSLGTRHSSRTARMTNNQVRLLVPAPRQDTF